MANNVTAIIEENIDYVKSIAEKISKITGLDSSELQSYGYEGLIYAARNYDEKKSSNIYNYLYKIVSGYILKGIPSIVGYVGTINSYWDYIKAIKKLNIEDSTTVNCDIANLIVEEMAKGNNKEVNKYLKSCVLLNNTSSLEQEYNNSDITYLEKLSQTEEEEYKSNELRELIFESLDVLNDRERKIIIERFGLDDKGLKTYKEIAEGLHTSIGLVIKLESHALTKLRHPKSLNRLIDYRDYDLRINGSNPSVEVGRSIS